MWIGTAIAVVVFQLSPLLTSPARAGGVEPNADPGRGLRRGSAAAVQQLQEQGRLTSLVTAVEATRYGMRLAGTDTYEAENPAQHFRASFGARGVEVRPSDGAASWQTGLRLRAWGYGEALDSPGSAVVAASGNRMEYRYPAGGRGEGLTEWYVNTARGIEQGFTLARPPAKGGRGEPLTLVVAVTGELLPRMAAGGQAIELASADGRPMLRYAGLRVWDAAGRVLSSRLGVGAGQLELLIDDTSAVYPVTVDPLIYAETKLTASDPVLGNLFGFSVALSEDAGTVVVGADQELVQGGAGKAYVYVRSGSAWIEQAKLTPSDGASGDHFGFSLAISGNSVVVGAPGHAAGMGRAYVYARSGTMWSEQAKLVPSDGASGDQFGWFVGISGNSAIVGAPFHQANTGQAYVYVRSGTMWSEQAKLKASDAVSSDTFGSVVAIDGNTLAVGAPQPGPCTITLFGVICSTGGTGKAYVFVRGGTTWSEQAKLKASDGALDDAFGNPLSISGDTVVVGAQFHDAGGKANGRPGVRVWAQRGDVERAGEACRQRRRGR